VTKSQTRAVRRMLERRNRFWGTSRRGTTRGTGENRRADIGPTMVSPGLEACPEPLGKSRGAYIGPTDDYPWLDAA
jgi:hypothetical protein